MDPAFSPRDTEAYRTKALVIYHAISSSSAPRCLQSDLNPSHFQSWSWSGAREGEGFLPLGGLYYRGRGRGRFGP